MSTRSYMNMQVDMYKDLDQNKMFCFDLETSELNLNIFVSI